ncbi:MAG: hypothetical protein WBP59_06505 [Ilumatobacteraceae bacterium]
MLSLDTRAAQISQAVRVGVHREQYVEVPDRLGAIGDVLRRLNGHDGIPHAW